MELTWSEPLLSLDDSLRGGPGGIRDGSGTLWHVMLEKNFVHAGHARPFLIPSFLSQAIAIGSFW